MLLVTTEKSYIFEEAFNLEKYKYNPDKIFERIQKLDRLGVISKTNVDLLHRLRKIRNSFGHDLLVSSFDDLISDTKTFSLLNELSLPKNAYFVELERINNQEFYLVDMNPIKQDTSPFDKFVYLFNYLFFNLKCTIEFLVFENQKNIGLIESLKEEANFDFKKYIHTFDGSFNYSSFYELKQYYVKEYISQHIKKLEDGRNRVISLLEENLNNFSEEKIVEEQINYYKLQSNNIYEKGLKELEKQREQMIHGLEVYSFYFRSYEMSKRNNLD